MSKKQVRITEPEKFSQFLKDFAHQHISVVLQDHTVFFGKLISGDAHTLVVENSRLKKIKISTDKVLEFFADINA